MKPIPTKGVMALSSIALLFALGGCDRNDLDTAGKKLESAVGKAKEETQDAAARARAAAKNAADDTKSMGAGAAGKTDDAAITSKVNAALAGDKDLSATRIDVDTKDGVVTLSGPAPSPGAKERATELARNVKGVTSVNNKLTVKAG
jgi:hyperosmotically inducible periplasmic protein